MLQLFASPAWVADNQPDQALPLTVPAALLVVLACCSGWMPRASLALVFWPDAAPTDAMHHLRINLHRARGLLKRWGHGDALHTERNRVQLTLPSDMARLRDAKASGDLATMGRLAPSDWLHGWRLPGYDGFARWQDETAMCLQREWLELMRDGADPAVAAGRPRPQRAVSVTGSASPAAPAALPAPPGREAAYARLLASPAPALLLLGEPGAGKTTLLRAGWPHAPCLRGLEGLHAMPYRPLLDALREHSPMLARALRAPGHPLRPYRLDLARVLPELAPDEPLPPLDAISAQTRLVEALARAFEALTPVLLVDDLQWCDPATVEWLLMLAHSGRLRWRAAARRHEITPALAQSLQSLRGTTRLEELDVPPLSRHALAEACRLNWPEQVFSAPQLDRLHAISGGNPFVAGELIAVGLPDEDLDTPLPLLERVSHLLHRQLDRMPGAVRQAVEAAAVFVHAVPASALRALVDLPAGVAGDGPWAATVQQALSAGLLRAEVDGRLCCGHDLIRQALAGGLAPARHMALHRHAALWLAEQPDADALTIAEHWRAAQEKQTALAWQHRAADHLKTRGRYDEARQLWQAVAEQSHDAAQGLRARLELAACDLFDDLARGQGALEAVRAQLSAVANPDQHRQIEGRVLAALVDNRVFAGDLGSARRHAQRLRELVSHLPEPDRPGAIEVLIELAMREPDIPEAWSLLAQLRVLAPRRPSLLSFEGQIHWFGGQVQAAHDALATLLQRHPDHCRALTIENDLAVMLHALGDLTGAEAMIRRSLQTWQGVIHTETLSLLVLGAVLTSAGRHAGADAALRQALALARQQASAGFEAEARVRHARLLLQCGRIDLAQQALDAAGPLLQDSPEPMRVSQFVLAQALAATAASRPLPDVALRRLQAVAAQSDHPLVHVRVARVQAELALTAGDMAGALLAAERQAQAARRGGLQEPLAEAWLLQARARQEAGEPATTVLGLLHEAATVAEHCGFADLHWRASRGLAALGVAGAGAQSRNALARLRGSDRPALFSATAAARREPRWP